MAEHLAQDDDFLADARKILAIDDNAYARLATQLAKEDAFISLNDLKSIVSGPLKDKDDAERVAEIIYRVGGIVHDAEMDNRKAMDILASVIEEKSESLDQNERKTLVERLRKLAAEPIGIAKQYKARSLVDVIGSELDDFKIICDIRPIFDESRKRVDGAIPLSVLRLEYTEQDGDSSVIEMRITEKQLAMLAEKIADANHKLKLIKELMASHSVPIPRTSATVSESEST